MKLCPACCRHLRPAESACPFCGAALREASHAPLRAALMAVALGAACSERPIEETSETSTTSAASTSGTSGTSSTSSTTAAPTTSSGSSSSGELSSTTDPTTGDSGCAFYGGCPSDFADPNQCDSFAQDCADGQKCNPAALDGGTWDTLICVPIDPNPAQVGEVCTAEGMTGVDSCAKGAMCWEVDPDTGTGICVALCAGTPLEPICPSDTICVLSSGPLSLCLETCDPLQPQCAPDETCMLAPVGDAFICVPGAPGGGLFEACSFPNECDAGLVCVDASLVSACGVGPQACCTPFCDETQPMCPEPDQACSSFFEPGNEPIGLENVGVCADMM